MIEARMSNPATLIPGVAQATQEMWAAAGKSGVRAKTLGLVHLRASQINGCGFCLANAPQHAKQLGETDERLFTVAAWRDVPFFDGAERAALALTEAVTRLSDHTDPVPDEIWDEAARHYNEQALAALVVAIATVNVWNRLNVATRQPPGASWD